MSMASKGGGDEAAAAVVCCMCGDEGLPDELFRCCSCHVRSQHKYCSHLYPRAESYMACNWCLRDVESAGGGGGGRRPSTETTTMSGDHDRSPPPHLILSPSGGGGGGARSSPRGTFTRHPIITKPLKKVLRVTPPTSPSPEQRPELISSSSSSPQAMAVRTPRQPFRGKVRRYKLLEEVSS